jgi:hypothetical protein
VKTTHIIIFRYKDSNDYFIIVTGVVWTQHEEKTTISDNTDSAFQYFVNENKPVNSSTFVYYKYLNGRTDDYEINIDDEIIKIVF